MNKIYTIPFNVRSYEVDKNGKATFSSICNYFQEAAGIHARHLNFDISQLHEKGFTWVLYKMHAKLLKEPKRWDDVSVTTWPSAGDGLRAFRDYEMRSEDGDLLSHAVSQWMVLDMKTKRPVRTPKEISELGVNDKEHTIEPGKNTIKPLPPEQAEFITLVGKHDLDMNHHVNNVRYIDWMTGYLGIQGSTCREMEIQYLAESVLGNQIYHSVKKDGDQIIQTLYKNDGKIPIASSISLWE